MTVLKLFGASSATELQTDPIAKSNCEHIDVTSYRWNSHRIFELAAADTFSSENHSGKVNTSRSEILCRTQLVVDDDIRLIEALKQVIDPELMVNIVDLGLVYSVNRDDKKIYVEMTLTSPACPAGPQIVQQSKMALERLRDVDEAEIKLVMSPPWTPDRMTDEAKDQLGIF